MNYEKKYKNALERAKKLAIDGYLDAIAIDDIFPELKESEDERIKREILDCINELANLKNEKIPTEWLEWLEKQSGQPTDKVESKFKVGDCEKKELKKIEYKMLDTDKVIEWLDKNANLFGAKWCHTENIIQQFKQDFGL